MLAILAVGTQARARELSEAFDRLTANHDTSSGPPRAGVPSEPRGYVDSSAQYRRKSGCVKSQFDTPESDALARS